MRKNSTIRIRARREGALARLLLVKHASARVLAEIETLRSRLGVR